MNLDDFQKSWQSQNAAKTISINADVLLNEVRRNQQQFHQMILRRDMIEVGVAAVLVPLFIALALKLNWTLHLCAFGCFVVGAYFLFDRRRQRKSAPHLHGSLKECAATSLAEVSHQIWLLKNIAWWYLLPLFVPMLLFFGWVGLSVPGPMAVRIPVMLFPAGFIGLLYVGIYWLNQLAVRKTLEPRRQELETLLNELEPENHTTQMNTKRPLGPLLIVLAACAIAIAAQAVMKTKSEESTAPATVIETIRQKHSVPALAVVVTKDGQIRDRAAAGVRKRGDATPVTPAACIARWMIWRATPCFISARRTAC